MNKDTSPTRQRVTIEERLAKIERDIEMLKARNASGGHNGDWLDRFIGVFENDPDFDEIVRLGEEFRHEDRPRDDLTRASHENLQKENRQCLKV